LLFSLASVVYRLLTLVLGAPATATLASDLAHDAADALVAGVLVGYHALVLRADARLTPARLEPAPAEAEVVLRLRGNDGQNLEEALQTLRQRGFEVEILSGEPPPAH